MGNCNFARLRGFYIDSVRGVSISTYARRRSPQGIWHDFCTCYRTVKFDSDCKGASDARQSSEAYFGGF